MSVPVLFSPDTPTYRVDDAARRIVARPGNWRQSGSGDPVVSPRFIYNWWVDGIPAGPIADPPLRASEAVHFPNEGKDALYYGGYLPGLRHFRFQVLCGNYYDNPPDDFVGYEWGRFQNSAPNLLYIVEFEMTVPSRPTDDPTPTHPTVVQTKQDARDILYAWIEYRRAVGNVDETLFTTVIYQCFKALDPMLSEARRHRIADAIIAALK